MRLYLSYAQNDAPYCMELVECLHGIHEIWYDQRHTFDDRWRQEIQRRLSWCDAFLYLLSAESLTARNCQDELRFAKEANCFILALQTETGIHVPRDFEQHTFLDLSHGLNPSNQRMLLNQLLETERHLQAKIVQSWNAEAEPNQNRNVSAQPYPLMQIGGNAGGVLEEGIKALNRGEYDNAMHLLQQAQESGPASPYVDVSSLLAQTRVNLQEDNSRKLAEQLYPPIRELVRSPHNRELGCQAFASFQRDFPHYDPDQLSAACAPSPLAHLHWCNIPEGETIISQGNRKVKYWLEAFRISRYPITHAQFQSFIEADEGYRSERWWQFSDEARTWHQHQPHPVNARFPYENHPRELVSWFEAMAFCGWLSELMQFEVRLPSEQQWQRAAQGDEERIYPWGIQFQARRCNCAEANHQQTTAVDAHPDGASPFAVEDLVGNVWEWCENESPPLAEEILLNPPSRRMLRGGSFLSTSERLSIAAVQTLLPGKRAATVGFRVAATHP